jgi:ABC-2 type transport system ATP-binding protein
MFGRLRGDLDPRRRDDLLERFELDPTKRSRTYSKGNRQKVALVAGLASSAELLLLDEPTSGLDPLMEAVFQETIREVKAEGRTVLSPATSRRGGEALRPGHDHPPRATVQAARSPAAPHPHPVGVIAPSAGRRARVDVRVDGSRVSFDVDGDHLDGAIRHLGALGIGR